MKYFKIILLLFSVFQLSAQETAHLNGVKDKREVYYFFKNAYLHIDGKNEIKSGNFLVHNDKYEYVGTDSNIPKSAIVIDLQGKHVYPGFIDVFSDYGMPEVKKNKPVNYYETQFNSQKQGAYAWNQAIKSENKASEIFKTNSKSAEELRKQGFSSVVTHLQDGIARGTSSLVSLADIIENDAILKESVSNQFSFDKGSSTQTYPVSLMGAVALLRQTYYDAVWYKNGGKATERNLSLEAFNSNLNLPAVFSSKNVLDVLRANKVADEFNTKYIIKTSGNEYQRAEEVKNINSTLIVPINFPKAIEIEDPLDAETITLTELKHWEMAPYNLGILETNKIPFLITSSDLKDKTIFLTNLKKAIKCGLTKTAALEAITNKAAQIFKIEDKVGSIKSGLFANFLVTNSDIFDENSKIIENWIQGNKYVINDINVNDLSGNYNFKTNTGVAGVLKISGEIDKPKVDITFANDTLVTQTTASRDKNYLSIMFKTKSSDANQNRWIGLVDGNSISGQGKNDIGEDIVWNGSLIEKNIAKIKSDTNSTKITDKIGNVIYPFTAYGNLQKPTQEGILIKNATVWTNEKDGVLVQDVLVKNGKIESVGKDLNAENVKVIDAKGKHLTNGIFDEHSHIALFSINEIESVSSEVRQEDAIDSEDMDIYRQLAGGVTTSQLLHGSADCIGGQSAFIKLKWGETPDKLLIPNAPKFIKFALGENVKRGNSPQRPNRYPASRMGVEQVFMDAFLRAKDYQSNLSKYANAKVKTGLTTPRRDLELDALVEILEGKRNITCHSYVQSEINMLMKLADSLGFKVNTFTHILEGYKVADKMKSRNINASTFSDWWAYKMEVKEAIPYNAAIMTKVGINTAINSDDAEMARRLNQEAAKTILYGGLTEEQAWKTVTLNPAKMCHLDDRLGSIVKGKDADLVIWSGNPLSVYSKPEKTIIDGTIYFDIDQETAKLKALELEKNRIVQKLLLEKSKGSATVKPTTSIKKIHKHCDSILEYGGISVEEFESQMLNN